MSASLGLALARWRALDCFVSSPANEATRVHFQLDLDQGTGPTPRKAVTIDFVAGF
jgi:hypothetical protein